MKNPSKVFAGLLLLCAGLLAPLQAKTVKLLTVGNSFANNATEYLPAMATAAGNDLVIFRANPGGCPFKRHADAMNAFERNPQDPAGQLYSNGFFPVRNPEKKKYSLQEALEAEKWDYVTIQQYSNESFKYETFEPYVGQLVACIRKHAPQAEILIHQTWAYREDYPGFANGKFTQQKMFEGLAAAYGKVADSYKLRTIPVGAAMQEARKLPRWTFKFPDATFNYADPVPGTKPDQKGSLNVGWVITSKSPKKVPDLNDEQAVPGTPGAAPAAPATPPAGPAEKLVATLDFKHANAEGKYLGACMFYGFLYGGTVADLKYAPPAVAPEDAATLRGIADKVLASSKK